MKKAEIKRRKRVVPTLHDQNHIFESSQVQFETQSATSPRLDQRSSATPSTAPTMDDLMNPAPEPSLNGHHRHNETHRPPMPVDFTHYQPPPADNRRKRSFSTSAGEEPTPPSQSARRNGSIDPSLAAILNNVEAITAVPLSSRPKEDGRTSRREELEKEAARIREMLVAKEREIAALGNA